MQKLLIIDGNSIANRGYYALPFLSNHDGKPTGAVYGFANILIKIISDEKPDYLFVAFDHTRKTFRNELYSDYKMQRKPTPPDLIAQFPIIKSMLDKMKITYIEQDGIEADDIIGTVSKQENLHKIILSGDRDLLQLISDDTTVWLTKKGVSEVDKVDAKRLYELFELSPSQITDLKGLMGDSSDNIPGVKGIGEKTAIALLKDYQNIENIYKNIDKIGGKLKEKLILDKDMAFMSKTLATIKRDCQIEYDIESLKLKFPFDNEVFEFFKDMDFTSLTKNTKLFSDDFATNSDFEVQKLTRENLEKLKAIKNDFCYDLGEMKFLCDETVFVLEQEYGMFEENISTEDVLQELKPIFEDEKITKITKNAKFDMHILSKYKINIKNYFDLSVADYVVSSGVSSNLKTLGVECFLDKKNQLVKKIEENALTFIYDNIEKPLIDILFSMEMSGFKINEQKLDEIGKEFDEKIESLKKEIYFEAGEEFNINSPKQVAYILFEKLGIATYNNKKQSTSVDKLDQIRYIPIVDKILTYRKYAKIKNTYIDVYKKLISESGQIIHTTFNQTLTATGRLSSSEPNLQNIPARDEIGRNLRKIFVSRFDGGKIISADYSQIELRLLADMSGEEKLIEAFKNGEDIHALTASQIFGVKLDKVTAEQRRDAKAVNFGIIYGISDYGLSVNIKSSLARAKDYISSYFARYPKVKTFMDENVESAKRTGYAKTKFGRKRVIPELGASNFNIRAFGERVAMNMPLQGTASDIIKLAMIKVFDRISKEKLSSKLILQIHDELIVDTYPGEEEKIRKILKEEMESAYISTVHLDVSIGEGDNLFDAK